MNCPRLVDGGVPFPMLSDGGGKIGTLYGVYDEDGGVNTRGRFLIDPDGVIPGIRGPFSPRGTKCRRNPAPDTGLPACKREEGS